MALLSTIFGPLTDPWTMQPDNNDPVGVAALKGGLLYNPNNFQQGQPQFGATGGFDGAMPQPANPYGGLPSRDALGPQMPQAPAAPQNIPIPQQTDVAWSPQFRTPDEAASTADANANPDVPAKNAQTVAMTTPQTPQQQSSGGGLFDMLSNIYGKGGPGDPLIALGMGMIGKRHIGEGLQQGFENMNRQQLVQATTANQQQKLAQSQAQFQSRVQTILAKNKDMPLIQAQAIAQSEPLWQAWGKNNIPGLDAERKPQLVTINGVQKWVTPGEADGTVIGPTVAPEQYKPLTDPAERAQYGISPDDNQPYRVDTRTNKVEGVGGGGTKIYNGPQTDYTGALVNKLGETHANLAGGVEGSMTRLRDISSMQGALQRIQQAGGTTGFGKEEMTQLQSAINSGAHALGIDEPFDVSDPQLITKFNRSLAGAQAKDTAGARVTNFEMSNFLKANAGLGLSPDANYRLLGIQGQIEERNVALGNAIRKLTADSVSNGRKIDPASVEKLIRDYDEAHHITDPITGQDLTKNLSIPGLQKPQKGSGESVSMPSALPAWRMR